MIDRQGGAVVFECDGCDEVLYTAEAEFEDAMVAYRADGWRSKKIGADWLNLCPECWKGEHR